MAEFKGFRSLRANFTSTPNQYFDRVLGHYHPCVERVVGVLIRATLGWEDPDTGERRLEAEMPLSAFIRPEFSESSVRRGLAGAIEAGFVVQTMEATTREPARYALRWEDAQAQKDAISRQRRANGGRRRRGGKVMPPAWKQGRERPEAPKERCHGETSHRETSHGDTSDSYKDSEKNPESSKKRSFKKGSPPALKSQEEPPAWAAAWYAMTDSQREIYHQRAQLQGGLPANDVAGVLKAAKALFRQELE